MTAPRPKVSHDEWVGWTVDNFYFGVLSDEAGRPLRATGALDTRGDRAYEPIEGLSAAWVTMHLDPNTNANALALAARAEEISAIVVRHTAQFKEAAREFAGLETAIWGRSIANQRFPRVRLSVARDDLGWTISEYDFGGWTDRLEG
jgi:hypothetical protein